MRNVPDQIISWSVYALLGLVHQNLLSVEIYFNKNKEFKVVFYIDREKKNFDDEVANCFLDDLISCVSSNSQITKVNYEVKTFLGDIYKMEAHGLPIFKKMVRWIGEDGVERTL